MSSKKVHPKTEKHVQTDMVSPTKSSRGQQTKLTGSDDRWVKKLTNVDDNENYSGLYNVIMYPFGLFVRFLRFLQNKLHSLIVKQADVRRSTRQKAITPEKVEEIDSRRKVSPRKRINSSIFRNIKSAAFRMLGFETSCVKQTDIRQFLSCSKHRSLNESPLIFADDSEKKRKHDDIETDSEESDDEDLLNMDLKNYVSDEDPDYEPTDEDEEDLNIDSEDSEEDESDLETVEIDGLVMLKDKENENPIEAKQKTEKKHDGSTESENVEKQKENKGKMSPKKAVMSPKKPSMSPKKAILSPRKQTSSNIQPSIIVNKQPVKPTAAKDEKKPGTQNEQGKHPDTIKSSSGPGGNAQHSTAEKHQQGTSGNQHGTSVNQHGNSDKQQQPNKKA